jgi:ATP/maltotriose-dependent transcriptional regulator MalT
MTIDERLEKLAERHEALVQYTELRNRSDRERHEALAMNIELLSQDIRQNALQTEKNTAQIRELGVLAQQMMEGITGLTRIVRSHEQRLSALEA